MTALAYSAPRARAPEKKQFNYDLRVTVQSGERESEEGNFFRYGDFQKLAARYNERVSISLMSTDEFCQRLALLEVVSPFSTVEQSRLSTSEALAAGLGTVFGHVARVAVSSLAIREITSATSYQPPMSDWSREALSFDVLGKRAKAVVTITKYIERKKREGARSELSSEILLVSIEQFSDVALMSIVRGLFSARAKISVWSFVVASVKEELLKRKSNVEDLFIGIDA